MTIIIFLVLLVIGFTIPGFLDLGEENSSPAEQRYCKTDADCYLMCDDKPGKVFCSQNLCTRNSCEEVAIFPFQDDPITFSLHIEVGGKEIYLSNRSMATNLFVKFSEKQVNVYSPTISLTHILEQVAMQVDASCLTISMDRYCTSGNKSIKMFINSEESYQFGSYMPKEGDGIKIIYS